MSFQPGAFQSGAFQDAEGEPTGVLDAIFAPSFVAAFTGAVLVSGVLAAPFSPSFGAQGEGSPIVSGVVDASFSPTFVAAGTGDSDGTIIIIPRDVTGGISYLVEIGAYDITAETEITLRYSSKGFNTLPSDTPANAHYAPRVQVPGDYSSTMFSDGTTSGSLEVGSGVVELINVDGGLDGLIEHAFDGRTIRIMTVETLNPVYAHAVLVFEGAVEQVEFTWGKASVRIRDRLTELAKPIQETKFAGTTTSGGMNEAEGGPDDIKGQPKPLTYGYPRNVPAVASNQYNSIFDLGASGLSGVSLVRDKGVLLTATGSDYATVAALRTATIAAGKYATAKNLGLIRTGSVPVGEITADPVEGATSADRTAAQITKRILERMGQVENSDFLASDVAALDVLNPAEIGYWISDEKTALQAIGDILGSIGATIVPDRLGVFRIFRFDPPTTPPILTLTEAEIIEASGRGIERLTTGDRGAGVPAWRVNLDYAFNYKVMSKSEIDLVYASADFKAFVNEEWRTVTAEDAAIKTAHLLSPELSFSTWLIDQTAAQTEANRRFAMHSVRRDRFKVPVKAYLVEEVGIGDVVELKISRFGLAAGKSFSVIGVAENFQTGITTLDLWG